MTLAALVRLTGVRRSSVGPCFNQAHIRLGSARLSCLRPAPVVTTLRTLVIYFPVPIPRLGGKIIGYRGQLGKPYARLLRSVDPTRGAFQRFPYLEHRVDQLGGR